MNVHGKLQTIDFVVIAVYAVAVVGVLALVMLALYVVFD